MLSFTTARKKVRKLGLKSQKEWHQWSGSNRPPNIPCGPHRYYKSTFKGWPNWLGYQSKRKKYKSKPKPQNPNTCTFKGKEYKLIPGFSNYYISQDALVLRKTKKGYFVKKPLWNKVKKRWEIAFTRDKTIFKTMLSRAVALAWIPVPERYLSKGLTPDDLTVDHKDEDPIHDHAKNLQWMTRAENLQKYQKTGKGREANQKRAQAHGREVKVINLEDENDVHNYPSIAAFQRGIGSTAARHHCYAQFFPIIFTSADGRKYRAALVDQPDLVGEVWKTVPVDLANALLKGADVSRIKVSSMGRLKNANGVVRSFMGKRYPQVGVGSHMLFFHRLVAAAFHPKQARALLKAGVPVQEIVTDHMGKDSSSDHRAANLQWVSRLHNLQFESGTRKRKRT